MNKFLLAIILGLFLFSCNNDQNHSLHNASDASQSYYNNAKEEVINFNDSVPNIKVDDEILYLLNVEGFAIRTGFMLDTPKKKSGTIIQLDGKADIIHARHVDTLTSRVFIEFSDEFYHDTLIYEDDNYYYVFMNYKEMPAVLDILKQENSEIKFWLKKTSNGKVLSELYFYKNLNVE